MALIDTSRGSDLVRFVTSNPHATFLYAMARALNRTYDTDVPTLQSDVANQAIAIAALQGLYLGEKANAAAMKALDSTAGVVKDGALCLLADTGVAYRYNLETPGAEDPPNSYAGTRGMWYVVVVLTNTVRNGSGAPGSGLGNDGDFYIDTTAWKVYGPKSTTWPSGVDMVGTSGSDGASVLSGAGAPGSGLGNDGDTYINVTNGDVYGPKATTWGSPVGNLMPDVLVDQRVSLGSNMMVTFFKKTNFNIGDGIVIDEGGDDPIHTYVADETPGTGVFLIGLTLAASLANLKAAINADLPNSAAVSGDTLMLAPNLPNGTASYVKGGSGSEDGYWTATSIGDTKFPPFRSFLFATVSVTADMLDAAIFNGIVPVTVPEGSGGGLVPIRVTTIGGPIGSGDGSLAAVKMSNAHINSFGDVTFGTTTKKVAMLDLGVGEGEPDVGDTILIEFAEMVM